MNVQQALTGPKVDATGKYKPCGSGESDTDKQGLKHQKKQKRRKPLFIAFIVVMCIILYLLSQVLSYVLTTRAIEQGLL